MTKVMLEIIKVMLEMTTMKSGMTILINTCNGIDNSNVLNYRTPYQNGSGNTFTTHII